MHGLSLPTSAPTLADLIGAVLHRVAHAGRMLQSRQQANVVIGARRSGGERSNLGRVALVGAGPGDPGLLTVKALRTLQDADVILHDQLVSDAVLALAPPRAELIDVGKKGYGRSCKQGDTNDLMVALAAAGCCVVRLKAGDPLMFGRLEEEISALDAAGIDFDIVPGISAAQAAATRLKAPLTRRRGARRFQAITGHAADGHLPDDFDWAGLADFQGDNGRLHAQGDYRRPVRRAVGARARGGASGCRRVQRDARRRGGAVGDDRNAAGADCRSVERRAMHRADRRCGRPARPRNSCSAGAGWCRPCLRATALKGLGVRSTHNSPARNLHESLETATAICYCA